MIGREVYHCDAMDHVKTFAVSFKMASPNNTGQASEPVIDRLKVLYPMVNEEETPLPRCWSPKDKYNYIGLSQNNLRVHYKGEFSHLL